jgi:hypothetical protein
MSLRALLFFFTGLAVGPVHADTRFMALTGILVEHPMSVSGEASGAAGVAGATYAQIGVGLRAPMPIFGGNWFFQPSLTYTVPGRLLNDGAGRVNIWALALPFSGNLSVFEFKVGPGILFYQYKGAGGTEDLPNGGTTTTYYRPSDSVTSKVTFLDLGLGAAIGEKFRLDVDLYINGLLSLRRDFSLVAQAGYFFY